MDKKTIASLAASLENQNPFQKFFGVCRLVKDGYRKVRSVSSVYRDESGKRTATVRVTMPGRKYRFYGKSQSFVVTVGKPNWYEKRRLKSCPKADTIVRLFSERKSRKAK